jgi:hypothetical protein
MSSECEKCAKTLSFFRSFPRSRSHQLHLLDMVASANPFARMKLVRVKLRSWLACVVFPDTSFLSVCGACKIGTLHPLFAVRTKTPRKTVNSRIAAGAFLIITCSVFLFPTIILRVFVPDSPQTVGLSPITINNTTSVTRMMPGSFDDDSEEFDLDLDELSLRIRGLGIKND